ncbi:uncharacterized protein LOC105189008 [Harpegnathos saltator]|uniref:uncharacterized protein LOC105189008 n=1 Tax=Harpegnathos saltator TaxID=610380 RepID=UPI00058F7B54|nr:uncharacterized protein LOC105189008 [Harpegnathos saltator]
MDDRDIDIQRILWRPTMAEPTAEYQLRTVTYGTTAAPFLALRVPQQLTEDEGARYPLAVPVLRHNTYVDDCIFGADTLELAAKIRNQLTALLSCGGFILRKWASNRLQLLDGVDPENHGLSPEPLNSRSCPKFTISRFYDPLGLATPVLVKAKMLMQHLWALKCGWDETIPESVKTEWACIHADLPALEELIVPRWTGFRPGPRSYKLHAFADASTRAYAATIYLRAIPQLDSSAVTLLIAKSRVAPLKTISVPRLELCTAVLSARLLRLVTTTLKLEASPTYCWTDSTIVLALLAQPPSRWKTFVVNRVAYIQALTAGTRWRHVPTCDNLADCASRGLSSTAIKAHQLWWSGPRWLQNHSDD